MQLNASYVKYNLLQRPFLLAQLEMDEPITRTKNNTNPARIIRIIYFTPDILIHFFKTTLYVLNMKQLSISVILLIKMAMGTRNPSTWRVLSDKKMGMEWVFYPWIYYWAKSCTRRVWRVRVRMYTTHTRLPAGKKYPHKKISHLKCLTHFSPYGPWIWPKSN